jgi:hypothetical protein
LDQRRIDLVIVLLQLMPELELDVFIDPTDSKAESPEYWLREFSEYWLRDGGSPIGRRLLPNMERIFEAARSFEQRYRRERRQLMRFLLADRLPYVLLGLIDDYGAAPLRKE